jgi:hypothetical protein
MNRTITSLLCPLIAVYNILCIHLGNPTTQGTLFITATELENGLKIYQFYFVFFSFLMLDLL